ncbi:uncharacterized protein LOC132548165 [Ylistrum balloti]|uniref:uncharacterized protein LOC132548165 n=1 Tax=Ylistrum balloti TaxID=509963 RepID=UPI002905D8E4|nr:uncharacterized protein LOC132548165 [Ylistrum balloti]
MNALSELPVGEAFLYWIPSLFIVLTMVVVLCASFWRFHRKKMMKRVLQYDYIEANLDVKRPRIGAIHCFSHEARISDLTMSLSSGDLPWGRSPRQFYNRQFSRSVSNPGFDLYGNPLGVLSEEAEGRHLLRRETEPAWYSNNSDDQSNDNPVKTTVLNSYYEDCGLPVPSAKPRKKAPVTRSRSRGGLASTIMGHSAFDSDSSTQSELYNRMETIVHSPRRLPDMENSYWRSVDPKTVASLGNQPSPISVNPDGPRSLSQQYEYDLYVAEQHHEKKKKKKSKKFKELALKVITNNKDDSIEASTKKSKKKKKKGHKKKTRNVEIPDVTYRIQLNDPNRERIFWLTPDDVPQSTV